MSRLKKLFGVLAAPSSSNVCATLISTTNKMFMFAA